VPETNSIEVSCEMLHIYLVIGAACLLFASLVGIIVCFCVDIVPVVETNDNLLRLEEKLNTKQFENFPEDRNFETKELLKVQNKKENNIKLSSQDVLVAVEDTDISVNKQTNNKNDTNFLSNECCKSNNRRRLIKSPFESHNTTRQQNRNSIRLPLNVEDEILNSEPTNALKNSSAYRKNYNRSAVKNVSLSETKESNNFCAVKIDTASKLNAAGANIKCSQVATKLASVSEVDESASTQSNHSNQKNSSPLIYVDTND